MASNPHSSNYQNNLVPLPLRFQIYFLKISHLQATSSNKDGQHGGRCGIIWWLRKYGTNDFIKQFDLRYRNHPCFLRYYNQGFKLFICPFETTLETSTGKTEGLFHHLFFGGTLFNNCVFHVFSPFHSCAMIWPTSALELFYVISKSSHTSMLISLNMMIALKYDKCFD